MDDILPIFSAVMAANLLTIVFVAGVFRARNDTDATDLGTALCLSVPLVITSLCFYLAT